MFNNAESSNFLKGSNKRNWKANFDWLINDNNMAKVLEGRYRNGKVKEMENMQEILAEKIKEAKEKLIYPTSDSKEREKLTTVTSYDCELCKDTEWIDIKDELGLINSSKPCKCVEIKRYKKILEKSGVSKDFSQNRI